MKNITSRVTKFFVLSCICLILTIANATAATITVTKTADTNDGVCDADCSLREAMALANSTQNYDNAIFFEPSVFGTPQTITLTGGQLESTRVGTLLIQGPGANLLTIDADHQ